MDYPIWDLSFGGGVLIGAVAIAHVLVSHFAVGGGLAIALLETLSVRRGDRAMRDLARRGSRMLILISTVFGAISGVGIWFTIGLVSPAGTSLLIHNYVWGWAIEWCFFILEVATALAYYATWDKVRPRTHLLLIWLYAASAFLSLVVIQGILSFMLTPGNWLRTHHFWDGFFNPSYLPGLALRTGVCLVLAGAYLTFASLREGDQAARVRLVRWLAGLQVIGALLAYGGYRWWEAALPTGVRGVFAGAGALLGALHVTRSLALWSLTLFLVLSLWTRLVPRAQRWPLAVLALLAAFAFLGGYERLREGSRKPFLVRDHMFSNGILVSELESLNSAGILSKSRWAARGTDGTQESEGRAVFRAECASCHTLDRYLSIRRLVGPADRDRIEGVLALMREDTGTYLAARTGGRLTVPSAELNYPFMPPLAGTEQEVDALSHYLMTLGTPSVAQGGAR